MKKYFWMAMIFIMVLSMTAVFVGGDEHFTAFAAASESEFTVKESGGGFGYSSADGSVVGTAPSLSEAFDAVASAVEGNVIINLDNVSSSENISLSGNRYYVVKGSAAFNGSGSFFTVTNGSSLRILGAVINGVSTLIRAEKGSFTEVESGTLSTRSEKASVSTMVIYGTAVIRGGIISYEGLNGRTGAAIIQGGAESDVRFTGEGALTVKGNTALISGNGKTYIDGGNFQATEKTSQNTGSGYAIDMQSDAAVSLSGGSFESVSPENTIYLRGNANSVLDYSDGTVKGKIKISSGCSASVKISDRTLVSSAYGFTELFSEDGELTPLNAFIGYINTTIGYRFKGWQLSDGSVSEADPTAVASLPKGRVTPLCSDIYTVTLTVSGETKAFYVSYGEVIAPSSLFGPVEPGYVIAGWKSGSGELFPEKITVTDDVVAYAVLGIEAAEIILPSLSYEFVYDGLAHIVTAGFEHPLKGEADVGYFFERSDDGKNFSAYSEGRELMLTEVSDGGYFRLRLVLTYSDMTSETVSEVFFVGMEKAVYSDISHPAITGGVYSSSGKLQNFTLEEGFFWIDGSVCPTVSRRSYEAYYLADPENYYPYYLEIELILAKADLLPQKVSIPSEGRRYEGKTSKKYEYLLPEYWRFADTEVIPAAGQNFLQAVYNIDEANYNDYIGTVEFWLEKGVFTDIPPLEISVDYFYNLTEYHVLFENYDNPFYHHSVNPYVAMRNKLYCGAYTVEGVYYNSDVKNYNDYLTKIIIIVEKALPPLPEPHYELQGVYSSEKTLADYGLNTGWRWAYDDKIPQAGTIAYDAFYNPDPSNYLDLPCKVSINISKAARPDGSITHEAITVDYSAELSLYALALDNGFSWVSENTVLNAGEYVFEAEYLTDDNYYPYTVEIGVIVRKISYDISSFIFGDGVFVYDGREKILEGVGILPDGVTVRYINNVQINAGKYAVRAVFTVEDALNYNPIDDITVYLTIEKAESTIVAETLQEALYDGKEHSPAVSVGNTEQTVCFEGEYVFKEAGSYTVKAYTLESANYKAGRKEILFRINPEYVYNFPFEQGFDGVNLPGRIYEKTVGISAETEISIKILSSENDVLRFEILLDGEVKEGTFRFLILIPERYRDVAAKVNDLNGESAVEIEDCEFNGKYLSFGSDSTGIFEIIVLEKKPDNVLQWWGWLLIAAAVAVTATGVTLVSIKIGRKSARKKLGKDQ